MKHLALFVLTVLCAGPASAQAYKWVDENGNLHFGDARPRDAAHVEELSLSKPDATRERVSPARAEGTPSGERRDPASEARAPSALEPAPALTTWTLPLTLPGGEQQFRIALPVEWQPLDRATLDVFEERIRQAGGNVRFDAGFAVEGNRFLTIGFHDADNPAAVVARLRTLPRGWSDPSDLPAGREVLDAERGVIWSRNNESRSESVSAMVILGQGVLDITLVTPPTAYDKDVRVLARAMADLELPPLGEGDPAARIGRAAATTAPDQARQDPPDLDAQVTRIRESRGTVAGVGAAFLLLISWPMLRRIEQRALRGLLVGAAAVASFMLVPVVGSFWGADPARGGQSWFATLLLVGVPLAWWLRRRATHTASNRSQVGIA